ARPGGSCGRSHSGRPDRTAGRAGRQAGQDGRPVASGSASPGSGGSSGRAAGVPDGYRPYRGSAFVAAVPEGGKEDGSGDDVGRGRPLLRDRPQDTAEPFLTGPRAARPASPSTAPRTGRAPPPPLRSAP